MKSIVQEASTIAKAVEAGWQKAGCPIHFSIKVLELPETNFFGFTKRSAKIALYFEESPKVESSKDKSGYTKPKYTREPREQRERQEREPRERREPRQERPERQQPQERTERTERPERTRKNNEPLWNSAMIQTVAEWLKGTLHAMELDDIQYTIEPQNFHLRITFTKPLLDTPDREKQLLASFSALILETLRKEYKTGFRGHKIVLTHA